MTHPDTDFHAWAMEATDRVRKRNLTETDDDWIAEELEARGKNHPRAVRRQLRRLLRHLLKWQYQPDLSADEAEGRVEGTSWKRTRRNARREMADGLEESPSLKSLLARILEKTYRQARSDAIAEVKKAGGLLPGDL